MDKEGQASSNKVRTLLLEGEIRKTRKRPSQHNTTIPPLQNRESIHEDLHVPQEVPIPLQHINRDPSKVANIPPEILAAEKLHDTQQIPTKPTQEVRTDRLFHHQNKLPSRQIQNKDETQIPSRNIMGDQAQIETKIYPLLKLANRDIRRKECCSHNKR